MSRIAALPLDQAPASARPTLEAVRKSLGFLPNTFATLAHAPAALNGYMALSQAMAKSSLSVREKEVIALAASQVNGCEYCLAAHTQFAARAGLDAEQIRAARDGRLDALAQLARQLTESRGRLSDEQLAAARAAGITDAKLVEVVAQVAAMTLTNYLNNLAVTEVDFPPVEA